MRRNTAHALILHDQPDYEPLMEQPRALPDSIIENIVLDMREFRGDLKAANQTMMALDKTVTDLNRDVTSLIRKVDAKAEAAEVNRRFDALEEGIDAKADAAKTDARFDVVDAKIDTFKAEVNARFDVFEAKVDARFHKLEAKVEAIDGRLAILEVKVDDLGKKVGEMNTSITGLAEMMKAMRWLLRVIAGALGMIPIILAIATALNWI